MGKIFISYRRKDAGEASRLADDLKREFGDAFVIFDVGAIESGRVFLRKTERKIARCSVLLAVIGPSWAAPREEPGTNKQTSPTDNVQLEIRWALERQLRVIPVLVGGASMPGVESLPEELKRLPSRNAVEMRHTPWDSDLKYLAAELHKILRPSTEDSVDDSPLEEESVTEPESETLEAAPVQAAPMKGDKTVVVAGARANTGEIFISYASADRPKARDLARALQDLGWSVWWDRIIPPGKSFDEVIETALNAAKCVIVLWSRTSVTSNWVKVEAAEGARRRILIPVLIEEVTIPLEFRRLQAADLTDWPAPSATSELGNLKESIADLIGTSKVD